MKKMKAGISVIEVVLAVAIFAIFATPAIGVILQGFDSNRLAAEQTIASQFASEGIEAVRSIKNQAFTNLVNTAATGVVRNGSNVWAFSGTNNTFVNQKTYTRVIQVASVNRDASGNVVTAPSGTLDSLTKQITSTVTWNFSPVRAQTVTLKTYMSDWERSLIIPRGGVLVFGDGGTTTDTVRYQTVTSSGTWSAAASVADVDASSTNRALRSVRLYASSTRNEKIMISRHYNGTTQYIYAQVFNGSTWGNVRALANWNASTFLDVRNFDGAYLSDGTFMVVYSDNTNTPKYQTWNGSTWTGPSSTVNVGGIPNYIILKNRPSTNEALMATFDQSSDTNTSYYNGSSWSAAVEHSTAADTNTKEHIDFIWSAQDPTQGALIYPAASNDTTMTLKICNAPCTASGNWSSVADSVAAAGRLGAINIDSRWGAEEFLACTKDAGNRIYCSRADTTPGWTTPTNYTIAAATDTGIQRSFDISYEGISGTQAVIAYSNNTTTPAYRLYDASTNAFGAETSLMAAVSGSVKTIRTRSSADNDDIMMLVGDGSSRLYTIIWDGTNSAPYTTPVGKAKTLHGTSSGSATTEFWYDFAWDKF